MKLEDLEYCAKPESIRSRLASTSGGIVRIFRQAISTEGFSIGPTKLKNTDLDRVHKIVNEIDTRQVFYTFYEDEIPKYAVDSVLEARKEIRKLSGGVWADSAQELIVQKIQETLGDFSSKASHITPFPANHHSELWKEFVDLLVDLRLKVWCLIAILKRKNGSVLQPTHLPSEIDEVISKAVFEKQLKTCD
jgi:hypothetical protein